MQKAEIRDIAGIMIGHAQNEAAGTGCTVLLCEAGAVAGVDVRGGAPGTRETDLLNPLNHVERIHGVLLGGGSAFGLDAAAGVMKFLEERGCGFDVGVAKVPIVTGAVLFDLTCGDPAVRPDQAMGYAACEQAAQRAALAEGSVGAGTGATVGKLLGLEHAMKGGFGSYCFRLGELLVGAVVAVNCLGDVVDPGSGTFVAGALDRENGRFFDAETQFLERWAGGYDPFAGNTTIGCIVTNAALTKAQANKVAAMAHNGYARTIRPAHTQFDGDTIFALATGGVPADVNAVGILATRAMANAVVSAVKFADSLHGYPAAKDL